MVCFGMSPAQEQQVCDALITLGWMESDHALHAEGVRKIHDLVGCSLDDPKGILHDLRTRELIDMEITPGGALDVRQPMPIAQFRWTRPK